MYDAASQTYREDLALIVESVFASMMGLEVKAAEEPCPASAALLTSAVCLSGNWNGMACVHCEEPQAREFTARFLGIPKTEAVDNDVRDVLGELANMIAGNLKCTLAAGVRVSIPRVTDGADSLVIPGTRVLRATFRTPHGPFWITLTGQSASN